MKIGFIGLGIMGSRMAMNLIAAGHEVSVFNRTKSKADSLIAAGAKWSESPISMAESCDVIHTMLSTPDVVRSVAIGAGGFLATLRGKTWVDSSTVNPSFSREMHQACQLANVNYLDAPVAGTKTPAENGELVFLVGGEKSNIEFYKEAFDVLGKKTLHLGEIGKGAEMKMLINLLLAQSMLAFSEALVLGEHLGFSQGKLLSLLTALPVVAPVCGAVAPKLANDDYEPNFPLQWIQKDLHLAALTAYENGVAMPSLNIAKEVYAAAKQDGHGEEDFTAIYKYLK